MSSSGSSRRRPHGRYRYAAWHGGPDPLASPFDVRSALDEVGRDVLEGRSVREALRDLLRRGHGDRRGLDDIRRQIRERLRELRRKGDAAGTLDRVRQALDQVLAAEREQLASEDGDDARFAEMQLDDLPPDTSGAIRSLDDYQWHSDEAREGFEQIRQMLRTEVLDAQFAGMKQALSGQDPASMQAVRDMLADLNSLLSAHAHGDDTKDQFADFMDKHGEFFPDNPRDTDDLIDSLARRQAAAERMMRSLSRQQRAELEELMSQALGDADLESQLAQLSDNLSALRPGMGRGRALAPEGDEPLGYGDAVGAVADMADLEALNRQLSQDYPGSTLDDIDVDALERQLAPSAATDLAELRDLERELERQGYLTRDSDGLSLTPKALRRLGESALGRIFSQLRAHGRGSHDDRRTGAADERTGAFAPWSVGDERPLDAVRSLQNATLRGSVERASFVASEASSTKDLPVQRKKLDNPSQRLTLTTDDLVVAEVEKRTRAAVALCVDLSFSMVSEERWGPMKQTSLALAHLISTRFRDDSLQIIGFDRTARQLNPLQLAQIEPEYVQGTNLHHALLLAGRHLRKHPEAEPVVLVITDGEPTAHIDEGGDAFFHWPPASETIRATVREVDAITRAGATLNFFLLGDDPGLARFVDAVARRNGGRVLTPDLDRLGEYVVSDYLRTRMATRRSA